MKNKKIIVIGEILFDNYIDSGFKQIGGAPFNFAFHLNNFGLKVNFISKIKKDTSGNEILSFLKKHKFNTEFLQIGTKYPTGEVLVKLDKNKKPEFKILKNRAYDFIEYNSKIARAVKTSNLIYYGTLSQRNKTSRETVYRILKNADKALKFYDINIRQKFYNKTIIKSSLGLCDILKLNEEEIKLLKKMFNLSINTQKAIKQLSEKFSIKIICLTKGEKGSLLFIEKKFYKEKINKQKIIDSVGAGDMFSAVLCLGILNKIKPDKILKLATLGALKICKVKGAIFQDKNQYKEIKNKLGI